jgi:hypothetical protein
MDAPSAPPPAPPAKSKIYYLHHSPQQHPLVQFHPLSPEEEEHKQQQWKKVQLARKLMLEQQAEQLRQIEELQHQRFTTTAAATADAATTAAATAAAATAAASECRKLQMHSEIGRTDAVTPQKPKDFEDFVDGIKIVSSHEQMSTSAPTISLKRTRDPPRESKTTARKRAPPRESEKTTEQKTNPKSRREKPCANCGKAAGLGVYLSLDKTGFVDGPDSDMSLIFCKSCADIATKHEKGVNRVCNIARTDGKKSTFHFCGHDHKASVLDTNEGRPYFGAFSTKEVAGKRELFFTREGGEPRQVTSNGGKPFSTGYTRQVHVFQKTPTLRLSQSHAVQSSVSTVSRMDTPNTDTGGSDTETDDNAGMEV